MADSALRRFLELVTRELSADDARAELGGRDPIAAGGAASHVFTNLSDGWRVVAIFDRELPTDERSAAQGKLERLAQSFTHTLADLHPPVPTPSAALPARRLDDALESLRARTGAVAVVVIDGNSPVLWGSSEGQREIVNVDELARVGAALGMVRDRGVTIDQLTIRDADALLALLRSRGIERTANEVLAFLVGRDQEELAMRHRLLTALAIAAVRGKVHRGDFARNVHHEAQYGYIARGMANIYQIVVVFSGPFSELHVESAILHAMPMIEELLFALPPVDPPPSKGQVIRLRPR